MTSHRHDYQRDISTERFIGVTLTWGLTPTKEFECVNRCACGATQPDRYIYFRGLKDGQTDSKGWPVDGDGKRLPMTNA